MRLSTKGRYGLHTMFELARHYGEDPIPLSDVSKATDLPMGYLEQLVRKLKKDNLVDSIRGPKGGYFLTRDPKDITVGDVLRSAEDFFGITECSSEDGVCCKEDYCIARQVWQVIEDELNNTIDSISLQDMVDRNVKKTR